MFFGKVYCVQFLPLGSTNKIRLPIPQQCRTYTPAVQAGIVLLWTAHDPVPFRHRNATHPGTQGTAAAHSGSTLFPSCLLNPHADLCPCERVEDLERVHPIQHLRQAALPERRRRHPGRHAHLPSSASSSLPGGSHGSSSSCLLRDGGT